MSNEVRIRSGTVDTFTFGNTGAVSTTVNQASLPLYKAGPWSTFQGVLNSTTFGLITGTINIQGTNDIWAGAGFVVNNVVTTNASGVVTSPLNQFAGQTEQLQDLFAPAVAVGMLVIGPGIPVGTIVNTVTNAGSITLSNNASATSGVGGVSLRFFTNNWCTTALATFTLTGTTAAATPYVTDGATSVSAFKWVRANVTNITGTGATVSVSMGI